MTWFRVDDKFHDHSKVRRLQGDKMPAIGLWSLAGSWAADNLTDGFVPTEIVQRFDPKERYAARLVEVGLWLPAEHGGEVGYRYHDWDGWQPTRAAVEKQREDNRDRVRRWRERNGHAHEPAEDAGNGAQHGDGNAHSNALQDSSVMDPVTVPPTRPDPNHTEKRKTKPSPPRSAHGPDRFEEFYAAYPRHVDRKDAERAWSKAIKTHPPDQLIDAAKRYAAACRGKDAKFIKYPATWLNKGGYLDEPDLRLVAGGDTIHRDPKTGRAVEW